MDTEFKVSIGLENGDGADANAYTRVTFDFQLQRQRIDAITEDLRKKTGKFRIPTFVIDFPESAKDLNLQIMKERQGMQYDEICKDGRVYKCLDVLVPEFTTTKKKIQKLFTKLTQLDNKLYLHLDLYNIDDYEKRLKQKEDYALVVFLEKSKIEGKFSLDPSFFEVAAQCISRVSPKFAESPIMAVLPLFGGIDCQIELDSLNQLEKPNQQQLFSMFSYEQPDDDEQGKKIKQFFKNKEKVNIYLSFGVMCILRIELEVRMFAFYNCLA